jgi:hypothetical protein
MSQFTGHTPFNFSFLSTSRLLYDYLTALTRADSLPRPLTKGESAYCTRTELLTDSCVTLTDLLTKPAARHY